jgi:hypothetical protein
MLFLGVLICNEVEIGYVSSCLLLMESKLRYDGRSLGSMPADVVAGITHFLDVYDLALLLFCGCKRLNTTLVSREGISEFRLVYRAASRLTFPGILYHLQGLRLLDLSVPESEVQLPIHDIFWPKMPPTVTDIRLNFVNALASFWDRSGLSVGDRAKPFDIESIFPELKRLTYPELEWGDLDNFEFVERLNGTLPSSLESIILYGVSSPSTIAQLSRSITELTLYMTPENKIEDWKGVSINFPPNLAELHVNSSLLAGHGCFTHSFLSSLPRSITSLQVDTTWMEELEFPLIEGTQPLFKRTGPYLTDSSSSSIYHLTKTAKNPWFI